jgi:hypothetical protein
MNSLQSCADAAIQFTYNIQEWFTRFYKENGVVTVTGCSAEQAANKPFIQ